MKKKNLFIGLSLSVILAVIMTVIPAVTAFACSEPVTSCTEPTITLNHQTIMAGSTITISGNYFTSGYHYAVYLAGQYQKKGHVDSDGQFKTKVTIPASMEAGDYRITVITYTGSCPKFICNGNCRNSNICTGYGCNGNCQEPDTCVNSEYYRDYPESGSAVIRVIADRDYFAEDNVGQYVGTPYYYAVDPSQWAFWTDPVNYSQ